MDGERYHADAGVPMARAATETQKAGPDGPGVRAGDPGHGRRRGLGERRGARLRHGVRPRVRHGPRSPTARRPCCRSRSSGSRYRHSRFKDADAGAISPAEIVLGAVFRLRAADPDDDQGAPRRHPPLAAGAPAAGHPVRGLVFRNPPGDSAGRLIDVARPQGLPCRRRGRVREARQLHRQRRSTGPPPTSAGSPSTSATQVRAAPRHRPRVRDRVRRRLVRTDARGDRLMPRSTAAGPRSRRDARRGGPGRPVGRARRVDRVGVGDRRRARGVRVSRWRPG